MSHVVSIPTKIHDATAVAAACQHLGLPAPVNGTARLYSGEASGLLVQLPGWKYPVAIDTSTGTMTFDNFSGHWGEGLELDRFMQRYTIEVARLEARRKGHTFTEHSLQDGSIRVQITEGT